MKTIGLIGGITWYSTIDYYRYMNQIVNERLGDDASARIILNSVNYGEIKRLTQADNWKGIAKIICEAAKKTGAAGADCLLLGSNTMHHIAGEVEAAITIPQNLYSSRIYPLSDCWERNILCNLIFIKTGCQLMILLH